MALLLALTLLSRPLISGAQPAQYQTDQAQVTQALNQFWTLQGLGQTTEGIKANWPALLGSSDWYEWNGLKINGAGDAADRAAQRDLLLGAKIGGINAAGAQAAGYVWPSNGSESWLCPHPHFDQMPRFLCAVYDAYAWSRDRAFLQRMRSRLEAVMDYLTATMGGRRGLPVCPGIYTGLPQTGPNTTYMDCYREGGQVAWIAEEYYTALRDMAALETVLGDHTRSTRYAAWARTFPAQFDAGLWNRRTRRYAGWRDSRGVLHDYGFTYLNLEALARGLGSASEASDIFDWLDKGTARPTVMGGHVGSTDIYQCVVAPRSNTVPIPAADWDPWSVSERLRGSVMGYGALVEDGGAMLWVNYYDVMARLRWLDADSAWGKFADMLFRVEGDPLLFTESVRHPTNIYGENYLEVGPADGPENGISGISPLYGFMGVHPEQGGLYASPNLPTSLLFLTCRSVGFGSAVCNIQVSRGRIITNAARPDGTGQCFAASSRFNTVGVRLTSTGAAGGRVTLRLQKWIRGQDWATVAAASVTVRYPGLYDYVSMPDQPAGAYRVTLTPAAGSVGWYARGGGTCRAAYVPVTEMATGTLGGKREAAFTTRRSFSDIEIRTSGHMAGGAALFRRLGTRWLSVGATWATDTTGGVLGFADQPAGAYKLRLGAAHSGTYRLLSGRYMVVVADGAGSTTAMVTAGGDVRLNMVMGATVVHRIRVHTPRGGNVVVQRRCRRRPLHGWKTKF